jgi:transcriptional regulator with XRE-family HTH domain
MQVIDIEKFHILGKKIGKTDQQDDFSREFCPFFSLFYDVSSRWRPWRGCRDGSDYVNKMTDYHVVIKSVLDGALVVGFFSYCYKNDSQKSYPCYIFALYLIILTRVRRLLKTWVYSFIRIKNIIVRITGNHIRVLRKNLRLSQQVFADKLGITRELINKMEKGRIEVSAKTRELIQDQYGSEMDRLMYHSSLISEEMTEYGNPVIHNWVGWRGIPVYNQPLNQAFVEAWQQRKLPDPAFFLPDRNFADCDFAGLFTGESMVMGLGANDMVLCQHLVDTSFLNYGMLHLIITTNGQTVCKFLHPHAADDSQYVLISDLPDRPPTPIKKEYIAHIFRVKGFVRTHYT